MSSKELFSIPSVSAIITCYNNEDFITEAIESVLSQTRLDLIKEIIVMDDGSRDASKTKILVKAKNSHLIKYVYQQNAGVSAARNGAISVSTGNLVAFLDADDLWLPSKIERLVASYKANPAATLIYSDFFKVDSHNLQNRKRIKANTYTVNDTGTLQQFFVKDGPVIPSAVMIKREVFDNMPGFDTSLANGEETELWLRIAARYKFQHVPEALVLKREVANSLGSNAEFRVEYFNKLNEKITGLHPELLPLVKSRNARRFTKLALYYNKIGNRQSARNYYRQAIHLDPFFWKPYFYYCISLLPYRSEAQFTGFLKRIRVIFK